MFCTLLPFVTYLLSIHLSRFSLYINIIIMEIYDPFLFLLFFLELVTK
jgi:hypothetical protein